MTATVHLSPQTLLLYFLCLFLMSFHPFPCLLFISSKFSVSPFLNAFVVFFLVTWHGWDISLMLYAIIWSCHTMHVICTCSQKTHFYPLCTKKQTVKYPLFSSVLFYSATSLRRNWHRWNSLTISVPLAKQCMHGHHQFTPAQGSSGSSAWPTGWARLSRLQLLQPRERERDKLKMP